MFLSRQLNACINRLYERIFWVVYRDFESLFEGLLKSLVLNLLEFTDVPYNLRNQSECNCSIPCTKRYAIEAASSIDPKLWDKFPTEIKNSKSPDEFKVQIGSKLDSQKLSL